MWNDKEIEEARRALITYYTSLQHSQSTRLIGFVAGLFTLLQLTQVSETLRTIFPYIQIIQNFPPEWWNIIRFTILFAGTSIIIFFILRAIFRFCIFGLLSSAVTNLVEDDYNTTLKELGEAAENKGPVQLMKIAASRKLIRGDRKAYGFSANLFLQYKSSEYETPKYRGVIYLAILTLLATISLLAVLW